jgi:hypothetical protein
MVRLVIWMSMYLRRSGSRTRLRFIPSGVNEAAFELHAQLPPAGSISQSRGAVVDPSSASFEVCGSSGRRGGGCVGGRGCERGRLALGGSPGNLAGRCRDDGKSVRGTKLRRFFNGGAIGIPRAGSGEPKLTCG